jgi:hypothetical protein
MELECSSMTAQHDENEILGKFEQANVPEPYREYYVAKRHNFFASIEGFRSLWDCFMLLDKIWICELEDMKKANDINKMFPLILFINAHAKMRIAFELGFSGCLPEAHSILRDAIESSAHGHRIFSDSKRLQAWLEKNDGKPGKKAFEDEFWNEKEERLFDGLSELYRLWKQFSESGSHTNINSVASRFVVKESSAHVEWLLNYTGVEPKVLVQALFEMLLVFHLMEEVLFKDCNDRLKLDTELDAMRTKFHRDKESVRHIIIVSLKIPRPAVATAG